MTSRLGTGIPLNLFYSVLTAPLCLWGADWGIEREPVSLHTWDRGIRATLQVQTDSVMVQAWFSPSDIWHSNLFNAGIPYLKQEFLIFTFHCVGKLLIIHAILILLFWLSSPTQYTFLILCMQNPWMNAKRKFVKGLMVMALFLVIC